MAKILKGFFVLVGALIVLLIVVLLGATAYFNWSDPRAAIQNMLHERTGWQVHLQGPVSLSFIPHLRVKAAHVLVDQIPGFSGPLLQANVMDMSLKSIALIMSKELDPDYVYLANASINLHKDASGKMNWLPQPHAKVTTSQASAISQVVNNAMPDVATNLKTGDFILKHIAFHWQDDQTLKSLSVKDFNLVGKLDMFCSLAAPNTCLSNINSEGAIDISGLVSAIPRNANSTTAAIFNAARISGNMKGNVEVQRFDSAHVDYTLKKGVLTFNNLKLLSKTQVLQGKGQVDLINHTINANMAVAQPSSNNAFADGLVFQVTGSTKRPRIIVDQASVQRYVKKTLGGKAKSMINNYLTKHHPFSKMFDR